MRIFAERLRAARQERGLTQAQVANAIAVVRTTYTKYETDVTAPPPEILVALCRYLQVSADYLLGLEE